MTASSDAAEQVVRLSLEGAEVAAKITGEATKELIVLLISALKQEQRTKGKARLTNMIKSGKELKVFQISNKDLQQFVKEAKRYGVLYSVLRDRNNKNPDATIDVIARLEDASKIQRIQEKLQLASIKDKAEIVTEIQKGKDEKKPQEKAQPEKSQGQLDAERILAAPIKKEETQQGNPSSAKTEKSPLSERSSGTTKALADEGTAKKERPSVREKLNNFKKQIQKQNEISREKELADSKAKPNRETKHTQPKRRRPKKDKER